MLEGKFLQWFRETVSGLLHSGYISEVYVFVSDLLSEKVIMYVYMLCSSMVFWVAGKGNG